METKLKYLLGSGNTLRFKNIGIKYFRKMGIWTLNTLLNIGLILRCIIGNDVFFRFLSASKLVYFSDLLVFNYAYFCLQVKLNLYTF